MALQEGSSENIAEVRYHFGADKGTWIITNLDTYGNIVQAKEYTGTTLLMQQDIYYASFKELTSTAVIGNWVGAGDDDSVASESNAWLDGSTEVVRLTYTYSTGTAIVKDPTTAIGDISDWISATCVSGYITVWLRFSDYSNVTAVTLKVGSTADGSTNYRSVSITGGAEYNSYIANDIWFPLVFDLSTGSSTGSPNGASIAHLSLTFTIAAGTSQTIDINCFYAAKESTTIVSGEDLFEIGRTKQAWQSEGIDYEAKYVYDADENICGKVRNDGY